MKLLALAIILFTSLQSFAAGGVYCTIDDQQISVEVGGVLSHGMPTGPFQTFGSLKFKDSTYSDLSLTDFSDIVQFWADGDVLNLLVYAEPHSDHYSAYTLTIKTHHSIHDGIDSIYDGTYELIVYTSGRKDPIELKGKVSCSVD